VIASRSKRQTPRSCRVALIPGGTGPTGFSAALRSGTNMAASKRMRRATLVASLVVFLDRVFIVLDNLLALPVEKVLPEEAVLKGYE